MLQNSELQKLKYNLTEVEGPVVLGAEIFALTAGVVAVAGVDYALLA